MILVVILFHLRSSSWFTHNNVINSQNGYCHISSQLDTPQFGFKVVNQVVGVCKDIGRLASVYVETVIDCGIIGSMQVGNTFNEIVTVVFTQGAGQELECFPKFLYCILFEAFQLYSFLLEVF